MTNYRDAQVMMNGHKENRTSRSNKGGLASEKPKTCSCMQWGAPGGNNTLLEFTWIVT